MRIRSLIFLALAFSIAAFARAQDDAPTIQGFLQDGRYISPSQMYSLPIPVYEALGGKISDTRNVVTFEDAFTTHITIAVFPMSDELQKELIAKGKKDFLVAFFAQAILPSLKAQLPGSSVEGAKFLGKTKDGALLLQTLMPGGSMFLRRIAFFGVGDKVPVAKRGNLLFIEGNSIVVISSELAERSTERSLYTKTTAEEDEILRTRLLKILETITFTSATAPNPITDPAAVAK